MGCQVRSCVTSEVEVIENENVNETWIQEGSCCEKASGLGNGWACQEK
jgi:hypothetical protein